MWFSQSVQNKIQCNPDIRDPNIRDILSGPKLEPVLPKQNRTKPYIR